MLQELALYNLLQVKTLFWQGGFAARDLSSAEAHELDLEFVSVLDTQMVLKIPCVFTSNVPHTTDVAGCWDVTCHPTLP